MFHKKTQVHEFPLHCLQQVIQIGVFEQIEWFIIITVRLENCLAVIIREPPVAMHAFIELHFGEQDIRKHSRHFVHRIFHVIRDFIEVGRFRPFAHYTLQENLDTPIFGALHLTIAFQEIQNTGAKGLFNGLI